jgi:hypothetical protein
MAHAARAAIAMALASCASPPQPPPAAAAPPPPPPTAAAPTAAAPPQPVYPAMAKVAEYRATSVPEEVLLARSAAPPSVSDAAEVLVLGERGHEVAAKGSNGFVCVVQRAWANDFDSPQFWNPKVRSPNCFNAAAARSVLPAYLKRTEWVLAGVPVAQMIERTKAAIAAKEIAPPEVGSMCFMMSKLGHLSDDDGHWHPHLMFFLPRTKAADWGANLPGSPLFAVDEALEPVTIFMSPVRRWSDGTLDAPKT